MNQKDLLLVGGGLVAGYVICKMMNRNSSMQSFVSANGEIAMGGEKAYKWNGIGTALIQRGNAYLPQINIADEPFRLTGNVKILRPVLLANGSFDTSKWEVSPTGMYGEKYVETTLTKTTGSVVSRVWLPSLAVVKNSSRKTK
jgi:hypothetical protein